MATFTPPTVQKVTSRYDYDAESRPVFTTPMQRALYKYMRSLDRTVNVYVLSDHTVVSDLSVVLSDASMSSTAVPYPITHMGGFNAGTTIGPSEGAEGGPFGPPPPYAVVQDNTQVPPVHTEYQLSPYLLYYFLGGRVYANISANLVAILTAAKWDNYIT